MDYYGGDNQGTTDIKRRLWILTAFVLVSFAALVFRLWYLQIIKGGYYREQSEHNRVRIISIRPPRGVFYDRNGIPLAENTPNHVITFTPEDAKDAPDVPARLASILGMTLPELEERIKSERYRLPQQPVRVKENLSFEEISVIEANRDELPGVMLQHEVRRFYPYGEFASHAMGYISEMTPQQREMSENLGLPPGFPVGQYGIEKAFDSVVRGVPGSRGVEVDVRGRPVRELYIVEPQAGNDVILTIDYYAQKAAEEALGENPGAVVAIEPTTGEVLAMASRPGFDPNMFTLGISHADWVMLANDEDHPLNNRALQGQFPPGSTFKLVMALAGLETGTVTTANSVRCNGGYFFGNRTFRCWKHEGHDTVAMHKAIVESCDVYFYTLGNRMGIDNIAKYSKYLGMGTPTGIGIREKSGLIPSTEWKKKRLGVPWYPGETISCSIGQGYVSVTPIQLARMVAAIVDHGNVYQPHLVRAIRGSGAKGWMPLPPVKLWTAPVKQANLDIVIDGMRGVVTEPGGTAHVAKSEITEIGGKTGTAQVVGLGKGKGKKYRDHAWFVAAAPMDNPKIAVAVLVEHGGHGGSAAAPIAKKVIEAYLQGPPKEGDPFSNTSSTEATGASTGANNISLASGEKPAAVNGPAMTDKNTVKPAEKAVTGNSKPPADKKAANKSAGKPDKKTVTDKKKTR